MNWFELTMILSCIASCLILSFRIFTANTNPFVFMAGVSGIACLVLTTYCAMTGVSLVISPSVFMLTILTGLSVCLLDIAFIFMFRLGAPVSLAIPVYRVISILISALIGMSVFKDHMTPLRAVGILTACVAVYLLNCKTKEETHV